MRGETMEKVIETLKWLFDGIGTEAIGIAIGLIIPCGVGVIIWRRCTKSRMIQKAGDSSEQKQILIIDSDSPSEHKNEQEKNVVVLKQIAGDNSKQTQIREIRK